MKTSKEDNFFDKIKAFFEIYLPKQKGLSDNTRISYQITLIQLLKFIKKIRGLQMINITFNDINRQTVEEFLLDGESNRNWSVSTRNQKLSAIKSFLKYCSSTDITKTAVYLDVKGIPTKKETKTIEIDTFTEEQYKTLLQQPKTEKKTEYRNMVIMILLYDSACRIQELLDIKLADLIFQSDGLVLRIHGKGDKTRLVPLMESTKEHLESYLKKFHAVRDPQANLFYTVHGGEPTPMCPDTVQKFLNKYCSQIHKVDPTFPEHIYCHMFRHSRASHLYESGMPLPMVTEWLGHSSENTTRKFYASLSLERKREILNQTAKDDFSDLDESYDEYDFSDEELLLKLCGLK